MKKETKITIFVAVFEAILALLVGLILWFVQEDSVEKKTVETLSGYFEEVNKDMAYDDVLKFIYESSKEKDKLIATLEQENAKLGELEDKVASIDASKELIVSAQSFADSGDYVKALALLNNATDKTPQMEVMISDYQKEYEAQIIIDADTLVREEKYDDAADLIDNALQITPNSSLLTQKKAAILNSKPQDFLSAVRPHEYKYYAEKTAEHYMEMGGIKHYNGFLLGNDDYTAYAIFNLNAQYTELSGIIGHIDGSGNATKTVTVVADDTLKTIVVNGVPMETFDINYQTLPQEFSIDVTGVKKLEFKLPIRTSNQYTDVGFAELVIR